MKKLMLLMALTVILTCSAFSDGSITGQAFVKTVTGSVIKAAGNKVILVPVSPSSSSRVDSWITDSAKSGELGDPPRDGSLLPRAFRDRFPHATYLETKADGDGRFTFQEIPPGKYIVACRIAVQKPRANLLDDLVETKGIAYARVDLKSHEKLNVLLDRFPEGPRTTTQIRDPRKILPGVPFGQNPSSDSGR